MKLTFKDINNQEFYNSTRVAFVAGQYSIFNNIVVDTFREQCRGDITVRDEDMGLLNEFNLSAFDDNTMSTAIDYDQFLDVVKIPPVSGKWFSSIDYKMLTKKQRDALEKYMKRPNENGVLIITFNEFADYKPFLHNKTIINSQFTHIIQLSFPNRRALAEIVTKLMRDRGVEVAPKAVDLFIMRMSTCYDEYEETLDKICDGREGSTLTYNDMLMSLKGIENFVLEDFLAQLTVPIKTKKISINRKIYKMANAMIADYGARQLVLKLKYKVDDAIQMRVVINSGIVPVNIKYSVKEALGRLPEDHKLNRYSEYAFRKLADLASQASLRDWMFMQMILSSVEPYATDAQFEKVIFSLIHRTCFSNSRLENDIKVSNVISEQLYPINSKLLHDGQVDSDEETT